MKKLFIVLLLLLLIACSSKPTVSGVKKTEVNSMAKVLFVIAHKDFRDEELLVPRHLLSEHDITIASTETTTARGSLGAELNPDITLEQALERINEFDAVIFVGGPGAKVYFDDSTAHNIARGAKNVLAAICIAPMILANAGVLEGKRVTVWDDGRGTQIKYLESKGIGVIDQPVVIDGNIVTANSPSAARAFGSAIKDKLG